MALRKFGLGLLVLLIGYSVPLYYLFRFTRQSSLYSFILLVPFVSAYFAWQERHRLAATGPKARRFWAAGFFAAGVIALAGAAWLASGGAQVARQDILAAAMYSFVFLLAGTAALFLEVPALRALAFPIGFLVFLAPLPVAVEEGLETVLQHGSAFTAHAMLEAVGTPVFRVGTYFRLPDFSMEVAPECSGIRSTIALFVTSVVAGQMLLRSRWRRAVLALVVLPIALLRNGFRVFTIGELCVHVGPQMIESWIHRQGGPVFFALSLIPFTLVLWFLIRSDRKLRSTTR